MNNSVYHINKGINKPIEFKGLKAQYIWYLAIGLVALLIVFTILYVSGINPLICLIVITTSGTLLVFKAYRLSNEYGVHGMMKRVARRSIPRGIRANSRKTFKNLRLSNGKIS
jgi:hypothetical protein